LSVVFIVAPAVVASWPVLCGAIAGAAGLLGYRAIKGGTETAAKGSAEKSVEIPLEGSQVVADAMKRDSRFSVQRDDVTATFTRDADGRCTVHVAGLNRSDEELAELGQELVDRVTQQYAYHKVVSELKSRGFTVTHEDVAADQTIRIHVSKYV
jgi:hypothetical protein